MTCEVPDDSLVGSYNVYDEEGDARLDIRKTFDGYEALVTPEGGHPTAVSMTITNASLELSGSVVLKPGQCGTWGWTWTSVTIPRLPDGRLDSHPTIWSSGPTYSSTDPCCEYPVDFPNIVPFLVRDTTPPQLSLGAMPSNVPPDRLLPWDAIPIRVSEGVPASALLSSLSLVQTGTTGPIAGITWNAVTTPVDLAWDAIVQAEGRATDWDAVAGKAVQVVAPAGIPDLAGNLSAAFTWSSVVFADVGPPRGSFDFDQPTDLATWGTARLAANGSADAGLCETGGCALIGPFVGNNGIAGRLVSSNASELHVRYRLLSWYEVLPGAVTSPWALVEAVRPGQQTGVVQALPVGPMHDLGTSAGALHWASDWTTAAVSMPPPSSGTEIGFRLWSAIGNPCMGVNAILVIESIATG